VSIKDKGNRLREIAAARSTADQVGETVDMYEKIIELAGQSENGQWDELFSEELNKPSVQL
jgi:hypothetical protein